MCDVHTISNEMFLFLGDNIQTAISVARECGILSANEQIVDIVVASGEEYKKCPEISFNVQSQSSILVSVFQISYYIMHVIHNSAE